MPDPVLGAAAGAGEGAGQNGQGASQGQGQAQSQEPKWLSYIPETEREEARKSYMLQADYTRKTQELGEKEKAWSTEREQLSRTNKEYLEGWQSSWNALEEARRKFAENPTQRNADKLRDAQDEAGEYFRDYHLMDGPAQGQHLAKYVGNQLTTYVQGLAQQFRDHYIKSLQEQQAYINNYFGTYLDAQQRFPGDAKQQRAYLENIYKVRSGDIDPRDLAAARVTAEQDRQALIDEGRKLGRAEAEQEWKNQNQFDLTGHGAPPRSPYQAPTGDPKSRQQALDQQITERFGAKVWNQVP